MDLRFKALCFCTVTGMPQPQVAHQSGDIWYTEEPLSCGGRLPRLSTSDSVIDHDDASCAACRPSPSPMRIRRATAASSSSPRASAMASVPSMRASSRTVAADVKLISKLISLQF